MFPSRVMGAFITIAVFIGIAVWAVVVALRARRLTTTQRTIGIAGIVGVTALLTAWVIFAWPAYWD
jgi:hypothetical protein